jgi:hypothetical protein
MIQFMRESYARTATRAGHPGERLPPTMGMLAGQTPENASAHRGTYYHGERYNRLMLAVQMNCGRRSYHTIPARRCLELSRCRGTFGYVLGGCHVHICMARQQPLGIHWRVWMR